LVQCINYLNQAVKVGVPKFFLARAVLECRTLDEAERIIRKTPCASGFNHVLVQRNEVRDIEIAGDKVIVEKVVAKPYVHANHYLSYLKSLEKSRTASSVARYQRARELIKNSMSQVEMKRLLSDTDDRLYPICRKDATLGSAIFLPNKKEAYICSGHPCVGKYLKYRI